jgi:hypothetical protein
LHLVILIHIQSVLYTWLQSEKTDTDGIVALMWLDMPAIDAKPARHDWVNTRPNA